MTKKITTYEEMLEEEERLKQLLSAQKLQVKQDIRSIEEELRPLINFTQTAKKFLVRKGGQAATTVGIKLLVDGFVKNLILSKAGWITRIAVPFFLKNYASHLANEPGKFMDKLKHLFGKNGKVKQE